MDLFAAVYPRLDERKPFHFLFLPFTLSLTVLPFLTHHRRRTAIAILPLLLFSCLISPCYTFGDPSADYYQSSAFIATPLWFLEFAVFRSENGDDAPHYFGDSFEAGEVRPKGIEDCRTLTERLWWACALMIPSHRGIGWNWEAKAIPQDLYRHLPMQVYVRTHLVKAIVAYIRSTAMLVLLGLASTLQDRQTPNLLTKLLLNAALGWAGALWICNRLLCFYSMTAAASVALGVCETWQWPPLMGDMQNAWSVGRTWGIVYHQTMRQVRIFKSSRV